ncbi:tetratricopeptide repeat protein [Candidatus Korobacter versatilis]|uniref:tetratricopeptide repeat protein n=1 Tax=Candidatus Korobacter versatilis TaxID=658062 RepID=UPI001E2C3510|nr:tetratricopeptide repeat protein [Candidatus Koribacter versatilis]
MSSSASHLESRPAAGWVPSSQAIFRAGLVLLLALYIRTLSFDFVFDDLLFQRIPWIHSWHALIHAFRVDAFGGTIEGGSSYYRPFVSVWWALVERLTPGTAAWYHLATLLTQVLVYFTAFRFGCEFFEDEQLAALTAMLFVLHPCEVESTAWNVSGANNGQAAIYFFVTLIFYFRWWKTKRWGWLAGSGAFHLLALLTKESLVITPVLVLLHCAMQSERAARWRSTLVVLVPYGLATGVYLALRQAAIKPLAGRSNAIRTGVNLGDLWSGPAAFWWYLRKLIVPTRMAILHDWTPVTGPSTARFVLPLMIFVAFCVLVVWAWKRTGSWRVLFLAASFLLNLVPVIVYANRVTMHERYLQLPSYSFCALLAYAALWAMRDGGTKRIFAIVFSVSLIAAWSAVTWYETGFWDNNLTLWTRAVQVAPHSVNARVELARLVTEQDPGAGIRVLDEGLQVLPESPGLWRSKGLMEFNAGKLSDAGKSFRRSLEVSSRFAANPATEPSDVKYGRATALFFIAQIEQQKGDLESAEQHYRNALDIDPENAEYQRGLAGLLSKQGRGQ